MSLLMLKARWKEGVGKSEMRGVGGYRGSLWGLDGSMLECADWEICQHGNR